MDGSFQEEFGSIGMAGIRRARNASFQRAWKAS
jgi:hypothetical protein